MPPVGDSPAGLELSVLLTTDIIWFLARGALVLRWIDFDRNRRLDSTNALPMMPACLEVCRMATRRIARDEGLTTKVAEFFVDLLFMAGADYKGDTPLDRAVRAELRSDHATGRVSPPAPLLSEGHRPLARGGANVVADWVRRHLGVSR